MLALEVLEKVQNLISRIARINVHYAAVNRKSCAGQRQCERAECRIKWRGFDGCRWLTETERL